MAAGERVRAKIIRPLLFLAGGLLCLSLMGRGAGFGGIQASERHAQATQVLLTEKEAVNGIFTLEQAFRLALVHHPIVQDAKLDEQSMEISYAQQSAAYRPRLNLRTDVIWYRTSQDRTSGEWSGEFQSGFTSERPLQIGASWQLPGGPNLSASVILQEEDKMDSNAQSLALSSRWNLWPGIRADDAYYAWQTAQDVLQGKPNRVSLARNAALIDTYRRFRALQIEQFRLDLQRQSVVEQEEKLAATVLQVERGLLSDADRVMAEIDRDRAIGAAERAQAHFERNRARLADDLGLADVALEDWVLPRLSDDLRHVPWDLSYEETVERAIRASDVYAASQRDVKAAMRRADNARRDNGLSAYVVTDVTIERWSDTPQYRAFLRVEYDMLDGGTREANKALAELQAFRAENALDTVQTNVTHDVVSRLTDIEWLEKEVEWARQAYVQARALHEVKKQQLSKGLITEEDVIKDYRAQSNALIEWVEAYTEYETTRLSLLNMTGLPLHIEGAFLFDH